MLASITAPMGDENEHKRKANENTKVVQYRFLRPFAARFVTSLRFQSNESAGFNISSAGNAVDTRFATAEAPLDCQAIFDTCKRH